MSSPIIDYENIWTLTGTLHTATPDSLIAYVRQQFPVDADDEERETQTLHHGDHTVTLYLRHDALLTEFTFAQGILAAAPDATGTLLLEWPYFENHEQQWPTAWHFHGAEGIDQHDYELTERTTPTQHWDPSDTPPGYYAVCAIDV